MCNSITDNKANIHSQVKSCNSDKLHCVKVPVKVTFQVM